MSSVGVIGDDALVLDAVVAHCLCIRNILNVMRRLFWAKNNVDGMSDWGTFRCPNQHCMRMFDLCSWWSCDRGMTRESRVVVYQGPQ